MTHEDAFGAGVALSTVFWVILICIIVLATGAHPESYWHAKIIEHGAGQYHPVTGKFEWKAKGDE